MQIEDTSASKPFDFSCAKFGHRHSVEVKGPQTKGESVIVTASEVEHAIKHGPSILVLVHSIVMDNRKATGGTIRFWDPWSPSSCDLKPLQYQWKCAEADSDAF